MCTSRVKFIVHTFHQSIHCAPLVRLRFLWLPCPTVSSALQIPLALLEFALSESVSLTARLASVNALHTLHSGHQGKTTHQLEKYMGSGAYEKALVNMVQRCAQAAESGGEEEEGKGDRGEQFLSHIVDLLRCVRILVASVLLL